MEAEANFNNARQISYHAQVEKRLKKNMKNDSEEFIPIVQKVDV